MDDLILSCIVNMALPECKVQKREAISDWEGDIWLRSNLEKETF